MQRVALQQPISNVKHWSKIVSDVTAARSVQVRVLGAFARMAFLLTFGLVVLLCGVMTPVGSLIPVLRAVRVDPATVFRAE